MVLFLSVVFAVLLACLLWKIKVCFRSQVLDDRLKMQAELRLLFGCIRIPMNAETGIIELIGRKKKRKKRKRPERKRLLHLLLSKGRQNGSMHLSSFICRGLVGNEQDAFLSVMAAGSIQVFFEILTGTLFPGCHTSVKIVPSFDRSSIWIYMEGILEILPTQIIGVMIRRKGEGNI